MTPAGWLIMIVSVVAVLTLSGYCIYRVFTLPPVEMESLHGPADIDTKDTENAD
jgi:hypothetical protein